MPVRFGDIRHKIADVLAQQGPGGGAPPWWQPSDDGLQAANGDPATAVIQAGGINQGQLALSRFPVRQQLTISDLAGLYIPGSTTGSGTVYLGWYSSAGLLVAQTADFSAILAAADTAHKSPIAVPLTGAPITLPPDDYWIAELPVYANLTFGQPSFWGWAQNAGSSLDLTGSPATTRAGLYGTAGTYTTLPASITPALIEVPLEGGSDQAFLTWWGAR